MKIEVLVGMIASGKSTYARQRADEGALVVCHDDLTRMLHAEYRYEAGLRDCYRRMEESIVRLAIVHGRDVVIDRTHLTAESRARWVHYIGFPIRLLCPSEIHAIAFPVGPPEVHAARRYASDPRGRTYEEWLGVANHHHSQALAEPIGDTEGFDRIIYRNHGDSP